MTEEAFDELMALSQSKSDALEQIAEIESKIDFHREEIRKHREPLHDLNLLRKQCKADILRIQDKILEVSRRKKHE